MTREALSTGDTLAGMADYWSEALPDERRDMVWSLLNLEGLIYDLERHIIVGLRPRVAVLPVLALGLEATKMWEQREGALWLREEFWPPKRERERPGRSPNLSPAEQERALMLIRQGMPLRSVAELFHTSYESMRRLAKSRAVELQRSERKLTPEQQEQARALVRSGASLRQTARRLGISRCALEGILKEGGITK